MGQGKENVGEALGEASAVIDVRTPGEFAKGSIAGAVNIPLFENNERAEIGTIYKKIGRQEAIDAGMDFVNGRLAEFVQVFEPFRREKLLVYCARGGMRSGAVAALLSALGFSVRQLPGGYKAFRNYLLDVLENELPPQPIVLHGRTGVGKTLILHRLENALDLEGLARHRSSLFGAVNLNPRTQQQFDAHLLARLQGLDFSRLVWVEGESRKVGNVILPAGLRDAMRAGTCVLITASIETRVRRIIEEYGAGNGGAGDCGAGRGSDIHPETLAQLEQALGALTHFFGKARIGEMVGALRNGSVEGVVRTLLREYYDPRYLHAMHQYRYALEISSEDLDAAVIRLAAFGLSQTRAHHHRLAAGG